MLQKKRSKDSWSDWFLWWTPPAEMDELRRGIALWNSGGGQALYLRENVPEDVQNAPQAEAAMPRVHCADIQLTFNADFLAGQSAPWHIIRFDKLVFLFTFT